MIVRILGSPVVLVKKNGHEAAICRLRPRRIGKPALMLCWDIVLTKGPTTVRTLVQRDLGSPEARLQW